MRFFFFDDESDNDGSVSGSSSTRLFTFHSGNSFGSGSVSGYEVVECSFPFCNDEMANSSFPFVDSEMVNCYFPFFDGEMVNFCLPFCDGDLVKSFFDGEMGKVGRVAGTISYVGRVTEIFSKVRRVTEIFPRSKTFIVSTSFLKYSRCTFLSCSRRQPDPRNHL